MGTHQPERLDDSLDLNGAGYIEERVEGVVSRGRNGQNGRHDSEYCQTTQLHDLTAPFRV
jgi:hypothetical protein